jgi:DNA-directed RNA polymerase specialized sigma24 family protein
MLIAYSILTITLIICVLSTTGLVCLRRRLCHHKQRLAAVSRDLDMALRCFSGNNAEKTQQSFESDLREADLLTRLRSPATTQPGRNEETETVPERYRHVSILASHGLDIQEISDILQISLAEAEQIIKLIRLTG